MDRFISMWKVRELADKVTNVVMNYTEVEGKVREATSDEAWGPTGQQMQELALATFTYEHFPEVMSMLWRRMLHDNRAHWRRTYKCLLLLSYLVRNGSERVVTSAREHIYDLRSLENYTYVDDLGKDQGINVRHKVRELIDFIQDDEKLREERKKAKKNKDKYIGMSSEAAVMGVRSGGGGGGGGGGGWGEYSDRAAPGWDDMKERNDDDDYERDDSDGDYGHRKPQKENVYRDAEVIDTSPRLSRSERTERTEPLGKPLSISLRSPAKTKPSTPVKKIDLGAAASYGKSAATPPPAAAAAAAAAASVQNSQNSQDLLDDLFKTCPAPSSGSASLVLEDDFDPRAEEQKAADAEFGDFSGAFGAAPVSAPAPTAPALAPAPAAPAPAPAPVSAAPPDSFADFTSAFSSQDVLVATTHNNNNVSASPASNLDLLSELSPPPPPPPPTAASSAFGDLDTLTGHFSSVNIQGGTLVSVCRLSLTECMDNFLNYTTYIQTIQTEGDANNMKKTLNILCEHLPGPITVAKFIGQDHLIITDILIDMFSKLLSRLVNICLPQWPLFKHELIYIFTIEESFETSYESLTILCGYLKEENKKTTLDGLSSILLKYVKSDAVFTAFIWSCINKDNIDVFNNKWENYVQLLVTLPERVANRLTMSTPKEFSHENYAYLLVFQIIRALDFMVDSNFNAGIKYNLTSLSYFLSKVINIYYNSNAIMKLVDVIISWCDKESRFYLRSKLIQTLLNHLNRQAIDNISVLLLKKSPLYYNNNEQPIKRILGNNLDINKDWKDVLVFRIPFYVKSKNFTDTRIPENLIYYISTSKDNAEILTDLILRLANSWSDVKSNNVSSLEDHMYISEILVLSVKYRTKLAKKFPWKLIELKNILFKGMSKHLDILAQELRCVGMATIEVIFTILSEIDETDRKAAEQLRFDYLSMGITCTNVHKTLKDLSMKCFLDKTSIKRITTKPETIDLKETLDSIAYRVIDEDLRPSHNTLVTSAVKSTEQTKAIVKAIISAKLEDMDKDKNEVTLDSDDDLQPYDMSNDVTEASKKRPMYLRDLLEILTEVKDLDTFEASVLAAEELVEKQLKHDDKKLAVDLLDLFVHLEQKYHVDNFDSIKFNISVAIVCSQPTTCAEHLCKEIHTDVGRYSIATKLFMLDVLSESANRIAGVKPRQEEKPKSIKVKQNDDVPAEEIIRRRLINKTKYFHTLRPHPYSKATINRFAAVSDSFFYPLVGGFGLKQLTLSHHNQKQDVDNILMLKYLSVVGNIILVSKNCPKCPNYCRDVMRMVLYLRFSPEPKIQSSVISIIASIILALPESMLRGEFLESMLEVRAWLIDCLSNLDLTMRLGGPKSEAAIFAGQVLHLLDKIVTLEG
ncbi:telomere length regulation protein TEL2 homolog [Papilio machaon]|uniref:telomere length regulation protein TEL2 homolog n=1 Tax=Papilio machaon TaxID=76193 RepID=UPI001E665720|nr:telomere length regulation protein TEL2 homolog [Papilio machaon]